MTARRQHRHSLAIRAVVYLAIVALLAWALMLLWGASGTAWPYWLAFVLLLAGSAGWELAGSAWRRLRARIRARQHIDRPDRWREREARNG